MVNFPSAFASALGVFAFLLFQGCGSSGAGTYIYTDDYFKSAESSSSELVFIWSSSSRGTVHSSSSAGSSESSSSRSSISSSSAAFYDVVPVKSLYSLLNVSLSGGTFRIRFPGERCSRLRVAVVATDSLSDGYSLNGESFPCAEISISPGTDDSLWILTVDNACMVSNLYFSNCYGMESSSSVASSSSGVDISSSGNAAK